MRVAILAHARYPIAVPFAGGLEAFTWHLTRGLRARGMDVTLFAGEDSDPALDVDLITFPNVALGAQARGDVAMPAESQVQDTFAYLRAMSALARRDDIDVIHNNSLHYLPITMSSLVAAPVVTTLHTPPTPWLEPALRLTEGAATVAVSQAVAGWWSPVTTPLVIHNGVDLDMWPLGQGGDDLVWFGRIVPEKAPHLAALIARAAGRGLRIAGPIADQSYFERYLQPLLSDTIRLAGHLTPDQLARLVGSSRACLVTPGWDEPFGLVAVEAMACGTPVLALARGGLPEIVCPPAGELIHALPDDEVAALGAAKLSRLDAMDRREVRLHVEQHFDIRTTVDEYVAVYEAMR